MTDFIKIYPNVLTADFCQHFIDSFDKSPNKHQGKTGGGVDESKKVSEDIYLNRSPEFKQQLSIITQACTKALTDYVCQYYFSLISGVSLTLKHPVTQQPVVLTHDNFDEIGKPNAVNLIRYLFRLAPINAQKYIKGKGNYNYWHSEIYPQTGQNDALHRVLLFIIYLNDVDSGGTTDFYYQDRSIIPKAGSMLVAPCGFTHTHRGNVPISNDKYVLTSWMLFNPAQQIYFSP